MLTRAIVTREVSAVIKGYVTSNEAAEIANVTPGRIRQLLVEGRLKAKRLGRDWFIKRESIEAYAQSNRKPGPKPKK